MKRKTHRIIELIYDILGTGGISLYGDVDTKYASQGAISSVNTNYMILNDIFKNISIKKEDIFVDVGCGKGRLFAYLRLRKLCKRMIGIELDKDVAQITRKWCKRYNNIEILDGDVREVFPPEGTIYYLFNPFSASVLDDFLTLAERKCLLGITLIYCNIDTDREAVFQKHSTYWKLEKQFEASTKYDDVKNSIYPVHIYRLKEKRE